MDSDWDIGALRAMFEQSREQNSQIESQCAAIAGDCATLRHENKCLDAERLKYRGAIVEGIERLRVGDFDGAMAVLAEAAIYV